MRRVRWSHYLAAFAFFAFLWNLEYIYNSIDPMGEDPLESDDNDSGSLVKESRLLTNITDPTALDAIRRAKSVQCKRQLITTAYKREHTPELLTPPFLPRSCTMEESWRHRHYLGCYADKPDQRLLQGGQYYMPRTNTIENCIFSCIRAGQEVAGVQYGAECFCGSRSALKKSVPLTGDTGLCKAYKCPGNATEYCGGFKLMAVYETGAGRKSPVNARHVTPEEPVEGPPLKIVFLLQLNGRSSRQVRRMLKLLYRRRHFYYVHVDERQSYMYREMLEVERVLPNLKVKRKRFSSIWGGASLLSVILDSFKDLVDEFRFWPWEYVINLSEADMPLVSVDLVEKFFRKYRGTNFLRSAGNSTSSFIKKQGLDHVFSECERRMFRLGSRTLPNGIRIDGGSDWFALHRDFIQYAVRGPENPQENPLVAGLAKMYETALLPAESYFHTLAVNSRFCLSVADSNLKLTNWNRKQGCKCQYKHIVDWCGCSPNVIKVAQWDRLKHPNNFNRIDYFARKFDAMIDQEVITRVEAQILRQEREMAPLISEGAVADAVQLAPPDRNEAAGSTTTSFATTTPVDPKNTPGYYSYWESYYDSVDESLDSLRSSDYPLWLLMRSLGRSALEHVVLGGRPKKHGDDDDEERRCRTTCGNIDTIERLHVYREWDEFGGLLLQLNGTCSSSASRDSSTGAASPWSLEVFVKRIDNTTKNMAVGELAEALLTLEVGTKFDVKEEIFRNYAGAMTVDTSIDIRHHWNKDELEKIAKEQRKVHIIFLDPDGEQRGAYVQQLENPTGFEYTKLPITQSHQLEAGIWTVQLRSHSDQLIAQSTFPFLPANNGRKVEDAVFVDRLVNSFYRVQEVCRSGRPRSRSEPSNDDCEKRFLVLASDEDNEQTNSIPLCERTYWSSFSPDPKSEISGYDWKTGRILPR